MSNKRTRTTKPATLPAREPGLAAEQLTEAADADADERPVPPARPQPRAASAAAARPIGAESLTRNIMLCLLGLVLGFMLGFFLANKMSTAARPQGATTRAAQTTDGAAPPLDPTQATGELPPGHPDINGAGSGANGPANAAATSADAQQAMAAADAKPKDFDFQMNAAATFYKVNDYDKAQLYLQRALEIKPKDVDALTAMGNTKYDKGDYAGAADYYQRVLAIQPKNTDVQTDLGNSYFSRTPPDYQRAITEYRKTLAIDPKHEKALQNMAAAALHVNDKATARTAIEQLTGVNPNNPSLASLRESLNAMP